MGNQWEARISAIENIQEEFGHDIREIKERLVRLKNLFEDTSKPRQCILEAHYPYQINRSLDHSSKLRAICHAGLIAPTCSNQRPQLHLLSWQHLDLLISQAT